MNDATWISAFNGDDKNGGISWHNVGGDFATSASATTAVNSSGTITFSSPNLAADVQNWIDGNNQNYGWFLIGDEINSNSAVRFISRENLMEQPKLVIDLNIPDLIFSGGFEQL